MWFEIVALLVIVALAVAVWYHTSKEIYIGCGRNCNQGRECDCVCRNK